MSPVMSPVMSLAGRRILVTGAGGFLGGVTAARLHEEGATVIAAVRPPSSSAPGSTPTASPAPGSTRTAASAPGGIETVPLEMTDPDAYRALDARLPLHAVVHAAAVLPGARDEERVLLDNLAMTLYLGRWCRERGVPHLVHFSGCNLYGFPAHPCTEDTLPRPPSLYAVAKLACEHVLDAVAADSEMTVGHLRISAPYGPRQRAATVVLRFLEQAARGEPLTLMGSGGRSQAFIYEDDVAGATVRALTHRAQGVYNITGGESTSMARLAEAVAGLFGRDPGEMIRYSGVDPQEGFRGRYALDKAQTELGYAPETPLEAGLARMARQRGLLELLELQ
jgi:nucleoside-diphosphate-sugar epimerase